MSHRQNKSGRPRAGALAVMAAAAIASVGSMGRAATFDWNGQGVEGLGYFGLADNWQGNTAPANDGSADLVFGSDDSTGFNPTAEVTYSIHSLAFNSSAVQYQVQGSALTIGAGGVNDSAPLTESLSNAVTLGADQTWAQSAPGGSMIYAGMINTGSQSLTVNTAGTTAIQGGITGTGSLTVGGRGSLLLGNNVNLSSLSIATAAVYPGDNANISSGTITLEGSGALDVFGGAINTGATGTLQLAVDANTTQATVKISAGSVASYQTSLGINGTGNIIQSGGTFNSSQHLYLGVNASGTGNYTLTGGNLISAVDTQVGLSGFGNFNQTGGSHSVAMLGIGYYITGNGTYRLSGGTLNISNETDIGIQGTGVVNQSGGMVNSPSRAVFIGDYPGSAGTYIIGGTGVLTSGACCVGFQGPGAFIQNGGTVNATGGLFICYLNGSSGSYALNGGVLATPYIDVNAGTAAATMAFNGGTLTTTQGGNFITGAITLNVQAGGAVINPNGNAVTFSLPLVHDPSIAASDGGLTLTSVGTLTLTTHSTYNGPTNVSSGTLILADAGSGGTLNPATTILVGNGASLELGNAAGVNNVLGGGGVNPAIPAISIAAGGTLITADGTSHNLGILNLSGGAVGGSETPAAGFYDYTLNTAVNATGSVESEISAPGGVGLRYSIPITVNGTGRLSITAPLADEPGGWTGGITKLGPGVLSLTGTDTYTGATNVSAGNLTLGFAAVLSNSPVIVGGGGEFELSTGKTPFFRSLAGLTIYGGGSVLIDAPSTPLARTVLKLPAISFGGAPGNWQGLLDLSGNDLDVTNESLANLTSQAAQGYSEGSWNGSAGIISSLAAADTTHLTTVGVIQNNQSGAALYSNSQPFDGITPAVGDLLVKYTYFGDANLDGVVDGSDYSLIDAGYASHGSLTGWFNGDFNYDGTIDGSDYALIDNSFNNQTLNLSTSALVASSTAQASGPAAVPEPTMMGLMALGAAGLPARRRRLAR